MLYKEWIDFVIYPSNTDKVKNREDRLATGNALSEDEKSENPELAQKVGFVVRWNDYSFTYDNDKFEAM